MERPILFNGAMVRAILAGEKTVTRRPVKWRESGFAGGRREPDGCPDAPTWEHRGGHTVGHVCSGGGFHGAPVLHVPALVGDRLWVRETWAEMPNTPGVFWYRADFDDTHPRDTLPVPFRWRPSIHMPRAVSRLSLDVVSVRVERLHAIDDADAKREGVAMVDPKHLGPDVVWEIGQAFTPRKVFTHLWASVYGAESWHANPWVWRVEFKRSEVA